jgi:hypothetical protein
MEICTALVSQLTSLHSVHRFLSPLSAVPLIALTGFGLYELGFPGVSSRLSPDFL